MELFLQPKTPIVLSSSLSTTKISFSAIPALAVFQTISNSRLPILNTHPPFHYSNKKYSQLSFNENENTTRRSSTCGSPTWLLISAPTSTKLFLPPCYLSFSHIRELKTDQAKGQGVWSSELACHGRPGLKSPCVNKTFRYWPTPSAIIFRLLFCHCPFLWYST